MHERNRQCGFTLVEALISMAILAMLMTAIAAAIQASFDSYTENEKIATVTQTGRAVLDRMTREIRTAQAVSYDYTTLTIIPPADGSGVTQIDYQHDYEQGLLYTVTKNGTPTTYVLIGVGNDDVQIINFYIQQEMGKDWQDLDCTKSITISMELLIGDRSYQLTSTAAPRRNQLY